MRCCRRLRRKARDEHGIFLVWFSLILTLMLAMAGFAVDFWRWNTEGSREQAAADAAALAGAVFMPENVNNNAFDTAKAIATKNGYTQGSNSTTVTVTPGNKANQIKVKISRTVKNYFGGMVGQGQTTITKTAVGEYLRKVNMGSPINQFGNDPQVCTTSNHGSDRCPDFWANIFGYDSPKGNGDAVQSTVCGSNVDNCSSSNLDYDEDGYFFSLEVGASPTTPLTVQAFDPAFAHVGDRCGDNDDGSNLIGASQLSAGSFTFDSIAPSVRYSPSSSSPYCTGDQFYANTNSELPWTTYVIRGPDITPNDSTDNPVVCSVDFPGFKGNLATQLQSNTVMTGAPALFRNYFRRWYSLCTIANPTASSTYYVQVRTTKRANGNTAPAGGGANRYALRAGLGSTSNASTWTTTNAKVSGEAFMSIYANSDLAQTKFYLARVLPGAAGRSLILNFFDIGDAPGGSTGTLQVVPGPLGDLKDNGVVMTSFGPSSTPCTYTPVAGNSSGPPWGTFQNTGSNCTITNVSSANGYQSQWLTLSVPIPANYTCQDTNPVGCWTQIKFSFTGAVNDTTTWSAHISGSPVRIVE